MLAGLFSSVALLLAGLGLYGVMAYSVAQRTRESGLRMALGAQRRQVMGFVLRQGVRLIVLGLVLGFVGTRLTTHAMKAFLYGVSPGDPTTLAAVAVLLALVAALACLLPARRATKVDPLIALRND